jgi:hypothetical protein
MINKIALALAATLIAGTASVALAADDGTHGGFRELPTGGVVTQGINPVDHASLARTNHAVPTYRSETMRPSTFAEDSYGSEAGKN